MPHPRSSDEGPAPDVVVQPRRASWGTVVAGVCIALTGALLIDPDGWPLWISIIQIIIGAAIAADGARHLIRRRRLLGDG
ncbi:hypothetical protein [Nesterenkonia sp. F]|uniref:hypothetical protein n=1 Tax=Nesterenkonia sp. F TaxID=795955 RepID=UPI000255D385|nr:hypothetical protein [Nesterenkonia sp. F]